MGPPDAETLCFDAVGPQPVKKLVDDRLQPAWRAGRQRLHAERFAVFARQPHGFGAAGRKRIHAGIPDAGFFERAGPGVVDALVVDEGIDRLLRGQRREARDLVGGAAEAGALEQMRRAIGVPVGVSDR
jgi:hypothetical protein